MSFSIQNQHIEPGTKILFACMAADGHFNPLTSLSLQLQAMGCEIGWYVGSAFAEKVEAMGIRYFPQKKAVDVTAENLEEIYPERNKLKSGIPKLRFDLEHFFIRRGPDFYADIKELHQEFPFELMVTEVSFTAIPFVQQKMNIPVVTIGIIPIAETSKDLPPMGLGMTPSNSILGRLKQAALRWITEQVLLRKPMLVLDELMAVEGLKRDGNLFDTAYRTSTLVLQSGTPGFEYPRTDMNPNLRFIGALLPAPSRKKQKPWSSEKLLQFNKVILCTQGTAEADVEKLIVPTLEAFAGTDHLVIVTTSGNQTESLRQRFPQRNVIIEDFIPFADVMPYCDAYVTNGGYGGTLLGIQHKLPLVVAGVNEGKNEICARVGYFKLGINLKTEKPKPAQLKKAVEAVLNNDTYRQNVVQLSKEFGQYNPQELFVQYVAELLQQQPRKRRVMEAVY
ncbi:glycosyltransferase [Paracnuella aquatica]|uniref:glycosyltransferase n=1 Tax=Paracnuella aquatica TaxID=2268757 RepID=UPI000DEFD5C5|nr:nucleotide disphospho-sugar-binding domain-containing protein [Paracnuella aquatica]RPD50823.1 glycosyltransferase [Paracnuella aquatica]